MSMKIPISASMELKNNLIESNESYITNPYFEKELLTVEEAIDTINKLSGIILIDKRFRKIKPQGNKKYGNTRDKPSHR